MLLLGKAAHLLVLILLIQMRKKHTKKDAMLDDDTSRDDEAGFSANSSSTSSSSSGYGTIDPDWRSSATNGYRTFDTSAIDDWQAPTPEIQDLVDRINAKYDLGLEFIETLEDGGAVGATTLKMLMP